MDLVCKEAQKNADGKYSADRKWFLTINNYTEDECKMASEAIKECNYGHWVKEVGKECGTPHIHIWLHYKNARAFMRIKKKFPRANIKVGKGNDKQAKEYLTKDGPLEEEFGEMSKQGCRTHLQDIRAVLKEEPSMRKVMDMAENYQAARMAEMILKYDEPVRPYGPRRVYWHYGDTGLGKSWVAEKTYGDDLFKPMNYKWWDGYDGHKVVLLDDIRGDYCKFHEILKLTGESGFRVETKGGSRQAIYDIIYITSPFHPSELWQTIENKSQLLDRITEIRHFTGESKRKTRDTAEEPADLEFLEQCQVKRHRSSVDTEVGGNTDPDFCADMSLEIN